MRKTILGSMTSLLLPLAAYGAPSSYGYQRKAVSGSLLHENLPNSSSIRPLIQTAADSLAIKQGVAVRELVVMDAGIAEADKIVLRRALKPGIDLVEINSAEAGLPQLMSALSRYKNLAAIHVVSHAEAGVVLLGNSRITSETIRQEIQAFAALKGAMSEGGDLLFYGCDLAANEAGEELLDIISNKTGMDVAASNNLTGNPTLRSDWELEISTGDIEAELPFSGKALQDFSAVLAAANGTYDFSGFTDGGATLTSTDFIVSAKDSSGAPSLPLAIYGGSIAFIDSGAVSVSNYFYVAADGVDTASFELTGLAAAEYFTGEINLTNVRIVGILPNNSQITSTELDGSLAAGDEDFIFGADQLSNFSGVQLKAFKLYFDVTTRTAAGGGNGPFPGDASLFDFNSFTIANASAPINSDTDAILTAAAGITEPVGLATTIDSVGEAIDVFDFTIADGGGGDGLATTVSQIVVNVSGTSTDAERGQITWRLNGTNVSNVTGTYNADTITFSGLNISVADGESEIYTINAYFNNTSGLTEDRTIILNVNGDDDLTVGGSGTQMSGANADITNGTGTTIDVVATELRFSTQPAGSVSGIALTTQPVVVATDAAGNTDLDFTETITLIQASLGTLTNNTQAAAAGVATFTNLTYTATADQQAFTLTANDQDGVGSDLPTVDANSVTSDVVATQLVFSTQPAPTSVNSGASTSLTTVPVVSAVNVGGLVDTGYATDITLAEVNGAGIAAMSAPADTDLNGSTVSITPSSGVATFTGMQLTYTAAGSANETFNLRALSGGLSAADSSQLTAMVNEAPVLAGLNDDTVAWAGEGSTVSLDSGGNASLSDAELEVLNSATGDWNGASLTVQRNGTAVPEDIFGFDTSGASFDVSGSNLQSGGQTFATFTNTNGVLTISFTSSGTIATTALVNNIAQRITYRNDTPAGDATLRFTLSDGTATTTADVTVTSNTIYVTNTSDVFTIDPSDGVGLREAVSIATETQTIVFSNALAGQTITLGSILRFYEDISVNADAASDLTIGGGAVDLNGGSVVTLINGSGDTTTISSVISNDGSIVKSGAGTLTLSGLNTFSGTTTVAGGTLSVASDSNLGSGNVSLDSGTTLDVTGATNIDNPLALAGDATINNSAELTLSGAISGANSLTKSGAGTLTLSGLNTYSGSTTVSAGTLSVASDSNLGADTLSLSGGNLSITGATNIDNSISLTGSASVANADAATLSGVISGAGNLAKSGAGTLTLSATNTYTGTTSVTAGTLSIASDSNIGSGSLNLSDGSTLSITGATTLDNAIALSGDAVIDNADSLTVSGVISGGFGITKTGAATLTLSGTNTYTGTTTVSAGALSIAGDGNLGADPLTLAAGTTLAITGAGTIDNAIALAGNAAIDNEADATLSGVLSGGFGWQKSGAGVLTLSGTNTQTGTLNVSAGLLHVIGSTSSATSVASGATLGGSGTLGGNVNIQNGGTLSPGSSPGTLTINGDLTMEAGSTLVVEIEGAVAGTGYDQLVVTGAVDVTDATLSVTHAYVPGIGDSYTIIVNDAVDAITGNFSGVSEGSTFAATGNATELTASFVGGDGNDFTLTAPTNEPPVIGDFGGDSRTFIQGAGSIQLDDPTDAATVSDADSADFNNGTLVVSIVSGGVAGEDVLAINNQGTDTGQVGVSGADVTYEGTTIGSFTGGTAGDDLQITLNGNADAAATQALVRNLTYNNLNATNAINQANRTVRVTVSDGDGGTSDNADVTVAVVETVAPSVVSMVVDDTALIVDETSTVTVTFSEVVTNLEIADFIVANGALSSLASGDGGITWTATLTPTDGVEGATNVITLDNTAYTDVAGNAGTGTTDSNNYVVDTLRPTASLVVADTVLIAGETSLVTITFNEAVTGFTNDDLTIANGTLSDVSSADGGTTWTATLTPTGGIEVTTNAITLNNTGVADTEGNAGSGTTDSNNYAIDTLRPTASLVVTDTALVDGQTTTLTVTFSEAVIGLDLADLVAENAGLSDLATANNITWTATLTPDGNVDDATNVVTLANTGVVDNAGNTGAGTTTSNNYAIDSAVPTVTSVGVPADDTYVAGDTLTFTVNTSEAVTVNTIGGTPYLALTIGATTRNATFTGGSGTTALTFSYTVQSGDVDGDGIAVGTLASDGGTLRDAAGNDLALALNTVGPTTGVLVDAAPPTLMNLDPADNATEVLPSANLVITLNEDIALGTGDIVIYDSADTPFAVVDVTDHGGQLSIAGAALTLDLTGDLLESTGYYVQIANGAVTDLAGNAYAGIADTTSWSFEVADITPPIVAVIALDGTPAPADTSVDFLVVFDENANDLTTDDFELTTTGTAAGTIDSVSAATGSTLTVTVNSISGTGSLRLDVIANSDITDDSGNGNNTNGYVAAFTDGEVHTVDRDAPATPAAPDLATASDSGESDSDNITNDTTPTFIGTAEANATIAVISDIDGSLGTTTADGSGNWTLTPVTGLTEGAHIIHATVTDAAGNVSEPSTALALQLDTTTPAGHSVGFDVGVYNAALSNASFTFAGAEVGTNYSYTLSSSGGGTPITGSGTFASATDQVSGVNLAGLGDGTLTLLVAVTDIAGNAATVVTTTAVKDVALPTGHSVAFADTSLNAGEAGSTGFAFSAGEVGTGYTYTITSSGGGTPVTGNGTLVSATDAITSIDLSGLGDGALTLSVVVTDSAGNSSPAVTDTAALDQTAPTVAISSGAGDPVNSAFTATITFSEAVNGFAIGDITAGNATLSGMVDNGGGSYSVTVTPTADGAVTLDVAGAVAQDAVGNNNSAATQLSLAYDGSAPTPVLSTSASDPTNEAFVVDIAFGESVTGFAITDISPVNATLSSLVDNSNGSYSVTVTPTTDGAVSLDIAAGVAEDSAGNANLDAAQLSLVYDTAVPAPTITSNEPDPTNSSSFPVTVTFGEAVNGFVVGDITVVNASLSGFTDSDNGDYSVTVTPTADGAVSLSLAAGVAQDAAANDNLTASFSLVYDGTAPTLAGSNPADGATNVVFDTDLTLTFSEPVIAGTGNLTLFDAADNSVVEAFPADSVIINSNVLTLNPVSDLTPTHTYYLQIANTALVDAAGNAYAGIADETTLDFTVSNTAPVANVDTATVAEDASVDVIVLANDTDADSSINAASVIVVTQPLHGSTSVNTATGVITYTPAANYNGSDSFTYTVEDVFGAVSNEVTVSVTVMSVNDAPVAVADLVNTPEDNPVSIDVAANDTDIDTGDSVDPDSIVIVQAPAHGMAELVNGEVLYTPHLDYNGSDSFTYTIDDQNGATSNVATVIINVTGVNDLPDAADDTATVAEDDEVDIDVLANDSDVEGGLDTASVQVLSNPTNGTTSVDALTGVISYTPSANFHGTDTFTYVVQDDDGGTSNEATVTVTVTSVNDAPVANADTAVLLEDTAHTINVLGNDTDIDGTLVLSSVQVVTAAEEGSTSVNATTGAIVYTPAENFNGSDSFTYRVQDNEGAWSNAALVTITVEDVNDEPLANNDTVTTDEDMAVTIDLLANDSDVDGTLDPLSLILTQPANGVVTDNEDGTVTYDPEVNFFGTDSFSYTVMDDDGGVSNSAAVTITVNPVNDAPVISGDPAVTVAQDAAYSFAPVATDVDPNTTLTFSITNQPEWASFNATTGVLTGTPGNDHVGDYDGIVITVSDGLLSASLPAFSIEVTNVNDPPEISGTPVGTVNQDGSYSFVPNAVDVDPNTTLIFSVQNLPHWATFNPSTGAITGTPANSDVGTYNNIVISVSDGITTTTLDGFDITVANVNDPPMIVADSYQLDEGGLLLRNAETGVLANDSDIDGDNLIAVLVASPRNAAEFSFNENGGFRYQHNGSETRTDSFTYRISDGTVSSAPATVSLTINPVNDAPVFVTQPPLAVTEGALYRYDVGVVDPDSTVTLSLQEGAPEWLTLSGFSLSGTAPINELGTAQVVLRATDDGGYTVDQTYDLTVLEQEASLVTVTTSWQGLPSIVGNTVDLRIVLTHATGPAVSGATLQVSRQGLTSAATMANCANAQQVFNCPVSLAAGASTSFRLRVTPEEAGNLVVQIQLRSASEQIAAAITDVTVTERAVSQGNVTFNLANATALASINLLNDGTRELVAGTNLGNTVKLLNYTLASGSAQVLSEIENRGYTERVRVADIDQDGLEDIVVVNRSGEASAVYYDRGDEFVKEAGEVLPHAREALVRDLNDDGYPELILGASGFNLYIYENNEGVYDIPPLVFTSPASIVHFALLRRAPMDAPLEGTLVISSATAVQLVRFGLNPDGGPAKPDENDVEGAAPAVSEKFTVVRELPISGVSSLQLVDVDGDGREEIIASTTHQNNSAEASGVTVIGVSADDQLQTIARLGAASAKKVEVADFNGDGVADLLVANDNKSYQFYRGTGNPADWTLTNTILYHSSTLVIPEDVNGDGLADVLVYEDGDEQVELYLSAPDGDTGESADLTLSAATRVVRNDRYHFEYAVTVTNEGESMAEQPRVTVPLPNGVDVVSLPEYCMEDAEVSEVICNLQDLQPGAGQVIPLILAGDWRINNLSLTAQATSDALENDMADNTTTTSLSGMFEYKRARIKGGGGSVNFLWFGALMGLALARRRKYALNSSRSRKIPSLILPLAVSMAMLDTAAVEAVTLEANSYIEGSVGTISSDWDMMKFYYDLGGSTQEAVLVEKDDQRFGWQLVYGYRFRPWIALELGYLDSGQTELEVDTVISETEPLRQVLIDHAPVAGDGPYAGLRVSLVSRDQQEIYAKLGVWSWSAGYTLTLGDQTEWIKRSDEDWLVGLGFSQSIMERLSLGGNIQTTAMGDNRLIFVGLNLGYKFDVGR